jgi:hypothetical protein
MRDQWSIGRSTIGRFQGITPFVFRIGQTARITVYGWWINMLCQEKTLKDLPPLPHARHTTMHGAHDHCMFPR